jgi:hypothetical protein
MISLFVCSSQAMCRIRLHVGYDDGPARRKDICANTPDSSGGGINELTSRLAAEGPQEQFVWEVEAAQWSIRIFGVGNKEETM